MTECRQIESLLPPYVDGEASASGVAQVEAHLASCDACARSVQAQRTLRTVLRARAAQLTGQAPPGLATRITARLRPQPAPSLGWAGRLSAFGAAAVLLLALVIGSEFMSPRSGVLFAAQLAIDHVRCFVLAWGTLEGGGAVAVQQEYADRYGWTVPVPDSNADLDLALVGARRCPFSLGDHAHLRYRSGAHNVSLYVTLGERSSGRAAACARSRRAHLVRRRQHLHPRRPRAFGPAAETAHRLFRARHGTGALTGTGLGMGSGSGHES